MQEPDLHVDLSRAAGGIVRYDRQTLRLHCRRAFAGSRWIYDTEGPTLLVFDRRRPVRIKNVPLVEGGGRDLFGVGAHQVTHSESPTSSRSSACSHVGIPCRILYSF